jgi:hypothetical protein
LKQADRRTIILNLPADLYDWITAEQARLFVEKSIKLPLTGVVRMVLQRAQKEQAEPEPKRKAK